jgi:hypothetical protein
MTDFCIQLHPDRAGDIGLAPIIARIESVVSASPLVRRFAVVDGEGFSNLMLQTDEPSALWTLLRAKFFADDAADRPLRRCSMVLCEGLRGWDDYRILHHFDETQPLDPLPEN